jgi:cobalt/nickel transport system permease protein
MWALAWWLLFLPCLWYGLVRLRRIVQEDNNQKVLLALCGAFIFVLSALKIPSVTGSCSHPTGVGLAVISSGRAWWRSWRDRAAVPGAAAGARRLTTLGANGMSMAVIGPVVGYLVWKMACRAGIRRDVGVFLCHAGGSGDLLCHLRTARRGLPGSDRRRERIDRQVYGDLLPDPDPDRHC